MLQGHSDIHFFAAKYAFGISMQNRYYVTAVRSIDVKRKKGKVHDLFHYCWGLIFNTQENFLLSIIIIRKYQRIKISLISAIFLTPSRIRDPFDSYPCCYDLTLLAGSQSALRNKHYWSYDCTHKRYYHSYIPLCKHAKNK